MASYKRNFGILLLLISSLLVSACSNSIAPGMPSFASQDLPKSPKPKLGKDYNLVLINSQVIAKQRHYVNKPIIKKGRPAGIGGYEYRVGPQDILTITVWDHPELTIPAGEFRSPIAAGHKVGSDGLFYFPYAGKVRAAGRTPGQIREVLQKKLAKFITKPQVGVTVAAYRSQQAYISGEVDKPGVLPINDVPLTVRDIIAKSGGLTENASNYALLSHHKLKTKIDLDALYRKGDNSQNYVLRGGDSLHIASKNAADKVFVMGEVKNPGSVPLTRFGLSLAEALSDSGSIDERTANPRGVFVIRQEKSADRIPTVYQLQMTSPHAMLLADKFSLRPRDTIYVTAAPVTRWNRVISQLLPSISVITATRSATN